MAMREININNMSVHLPVSKFTYTLQVNDFFDLTTRQSSFSENIKLPKTAHNANVFELSGMQPSNSKLPYKKLNTEYKVDGIAIVENAWGFLKSVDDSFNFHFIDGNIDLYRAIEKLKITDLPLEELTHTKNIDGIKETWRNNKDYVYALADFGGIMEHNNAINIDFLIPCISIRWIWKKIFELTGFKYQISDKILENKYITISDAYKDVSAEGAFEDAYKEDLQVASVPLTENSNMDLLVGNVAVINENIQEHRFVFKAAQKGVYQIKYKCNKQNVYEHFLFRGIPDIALTKDTNKNLSEIEIIKNSRRKYNKNEDGTYSADITFPNVYLNAGESLMIIAISNALSGINPAESDKTEIRVIYKHEAQVSLPEFLSDIELKDLFSEILIQNALTPIFNKKANAYKFYTLDERLNAPILEWSEKPIIFKNEKYDLGKFARNNTFKYKYNEDGDNHNDGVIKVENEQLKDVQNIESKFYSAEKDLTKSNVLGLNLPRILLWKKEIKESDNKTEVEYKELKNHYHWLKVKEMTGNIPLTSIAYGTTGSSNVVKYADFEPFEWNNIINENYKNIGKVINEMKINEYLIALSPMEIQEFDFFCRIYHEDLGAVFIPNRIKYESENLSLIELIKIG